MPPELPHGLFLERNGKRKEPITLYQGEL